MDRIPLIPLAAKRISSIGPVMGLLAALLSGQHFGPASPPLLEATSGKLPIYFIENRGVYPDEVKYYIPGADKTLFFTPGGVTFRLKGKDRGWVVKLEFVGKNVAVEPRGEERQQAVFSYFKGPEEDWKTGLSTVSKVVYREIWPGIDLVYHGAAHKLKYAFLAEPDVDTSRLRLRYRGATGVTLTDCGALRIETPAGAFEDAPPVAWQEIDGKRRFVKVAYAIHGTQDDAIEFGFRVGDHDRTRPLVLDPAVVVYCGYIGGVNEDVCTGITVDSAGHAYVTGYTVSDEMSFPVKVGPDRTYNGGRYDAFVAKVNASGTGLVYCGYIGGAGEDLGGGIAVDASGNAYVSGQTGSDEKSFPVRIGPDLTYNGGSGIHPYDAFVAKVNAQGTGLVYCGYVGGVGSDWGRAIALDASGSAYVTGETSSDEKSFPVRGGPDLTYNGGTYDAFVARVNASGTGLVYCGYVGGAGTGYGCDIAVDGTGYAYVIGGTSSTETSFPVKQGPDLTHNGGLYDAFVARVNPQGSGLDWCGYLGGAGWDMGHGIALDSTGNTYVTGETDSNERSFPVKVGPDLTYNGGTLMFPYDAFVAKVNASGTGLVYCGYIGGAVVDIGRDVAVDGTGHAYVTGWTSSTETSFPVNQGPDLTHNGGAYDVFLAKVNPQGTSLVCCGYIGGSAMDYGEGIAVDATGNAHVTGMTYTANATFPVKGGPGLTYNGGMSDAIVMKVSHTLLAGSGLPHPGGTIDFALTASDSAGLTYQLGSSLGRGPIPIGTRMVHLSLDGLLVVSACNVLPAVFSGYRGRIDSKGQARAAIHIPNTPAVIGARIHTAFVTLDPSAPSGIRSISDTSLFSITR